jgi:hypothetical protein
MLVCTSHIDYIMHKLQCLVTDQDVLNVMGALYAATLFLGVPNASTVQPVLSVERSVMYRERAAGILPFAIANVTCQLLRAESMSNCSQVFQQCLIMRAKADLDYFCLVLRCAIAGFEVGPLGLLLPPHRKIVRLCLIPPFASAAWLFGLMLQGPWLRVDWGRRDTEQVWRLATEEVKF